MRIIIVFGKDSDFSERNSITGEVDLFLFSKDTNNHSHGVHIISFQFKTRQISKKKKFLFHSLKFLIESKKEKKI